MISLDKFSKETQEILPIVSGWGQVNARKIYQRVEDGWYSVTLGEQVVAKRKATLLEINKRLALCKFYRVYPLGTEGIPVNFDNFSRKGLGETVEVNFLTLQLFEVAKVVEWEDKRFYYYEPDVSFNRTLLLELRNRFSKEQSLEGVKNLTPELHYLWLLLSLQRQSYREFQELERLKLSQAERDKRIKEFQNSLAGRLQQILEGTNATLVKFYKYRNGYMVHWKTALNKQLVKSYINDSMRIISAGFCLSNQDKRHSMASLAILSSMFEKNAPLYITRE